MTEALAVPMVDLRAQYRRVREEVDAAVRRVLESAQFIRGEECALFEREFAAYCGAAHACGVGNGTDALALRERAGARSAWHLYTVRASDREALQAHLRGRGIATAVHYPLPIHLQPAMAAAGRRPGDLPVSERLSREVLSLPLYPELELPVLERVAAEVKAFCHAAVAPA